MIITVTISKAEIALIESGALEAVTAAAELYRYTLLQAAMTANNGPTGVDNYFVVSPPLNIQEKANTALCVPHPKDFPDSTKLNMDGRPPTEATDGIERPEVKTDIPNAFKSIIWNE